MRISAFSEDGGAASAAEAGITAAVVGAAAVAVEDWVGAPVGAGTGSSEGTRIGSLAPPEELVATGPEGEPPPVADGASAMMETFEIHRRSGAELGRGNQASGNNVVTNWGAAVRQLAL